MTTISRDTRGILRGFDFERRCSSLSRSRCLFADAVLRKHSSAVTHKRILPLTATTWSVEVWFRGSCLLVPRSLVFTCLSFGDSRRAPSPYRMFLCYDHEHIRLCRYQTVSNLDGFRGGSFRPVPRAQTLSRCRTALAALVDGDGVVRPAMAAILRFRASVYSLDSPRV